MSTQDNPAMHRHVLRTELRGLREAAHLKAEEVALAQDWSLSKVIRQENGTSPITPTDLKALLTLYGVTDPDRIRILVDTARAGRRKQWWDSHRPRITPDTYHLLGMEASAVAIDEHRTSTVPPLLRTPAYTTAFLAATADKDTVNTGLSVTAHRQTIVTAGGPTLRFLLDEVVLRRRVGHIHTMQEQLAHLLDTARQPTVSIRITPLASASAVLGTRPSYTLITPPAHTVKRIVAFDHPVRSVMIHDSPTLVGKQTEYFERAWQEAMDETSSTAFISDLTERTN